MTLSRIEKMLMAAAGRNDMIVVVLLVTTIMMMILPLPTPLVDFLIATNMGLSVLALMVALYLRHPVDFSTLPAVILILTVFRLSLAITTTRLVLIQADAGHIIKTFGHFVIAGNLIVGLVVFLIITIVQFIVITKGSERVAEVAARFSLDALPGKQMSIDADLRNGDIDQAEARRRRRLLERESQLYGAMDGAMKFVKGDAISGLVIIAVNLIGGMAVGTLQHGMALGNAVKVYSLLTVGDGLVSQIPALFVSISAGTVVTRVANEDAANLGSEIVAQFVKRPVSLKLAAVVLLAMAAIPGFPALTFLVLAAAMGGGALLIERQTKRVAHAAEQAASEIEAPSRATIEPSRAPSTTVIAAIGPALGESMGRTNALEHIRRARERFYEDLGVECPPVRLAIDEASGDDSYRVDIDGIPVAEGEILSGHLLLRDDPAHAELAGLPVLRGPQLAGQRDSVWIAAEHAPALVEAGIGHLNASEILATTIGESLARYASSFVGIQETRALLARMEKDYADLVREVQRVVTLQKIADVLRRLLDEGVSIRNLRTVLESLVEWGPREQDVVLLAEYVRSGLKRQICYRCANAERVLAAYIVERDAEDVIRAAVRQTTVGSYLALSDGTAEGIVDGIRAQLAAITDPAAKPVILTALDIRRFVRGMLVKNDITLPVLSYQDLAPEFTVQPIGSIRLEAPASVQPAAQGAGKLKLEPAE
jgi:type III secretion protein V